MIADGCLLTELQAGMNQHMNASLFSRTFFLIKTLELCLLSLAPLRKLKNLSTLVRICVLPGFHKYVIQCYKGDRSGMKDSALQHGVLD